MSKFKEYKGLSLSKTHKDVLENWRKSDVFNQSVESRKGKPTFTFYEGPPSANGMPGIHHVIARTIKAPVEPNRISPVFPSRILGELVPLEVLV